MRTIMLRQPACRECYLHTGTHHTRVPYLHLDSAVRSSQRSFRKSRYTFGHAFRTVPVTVPCGLGTRSMIGTEKLSILSGENDSLFARRYVT